MNDRTDRNRLSSLDYFCIDVFAIVHGRKDSPSSVCLTPASAAESDMWLRLHDGEQDRDEQQQLREAILPEEGVSLSAESVRDYQPEPLKKTVPSIRLEGLRPPRPALIVAPEAGGAELDATDKNSKHEQRL